MNIFLSWSGETNKALAIELKDWLKFFFHEVELWMSAEDIPAGSIWRIVLNRQLEKTGFGIICLTPENLTSQWLLFEAGALSKYYDTGNEKSITNSRVVPYCFNFRKTELKGPFADFQAVESVREGSFELIKSINDQLENKRSKDLLDRLFSNLWPDLEKRLARITSMPVKGPDNILVKKILCVYTEDFASKRAAEDVNIIRTYYPGLITEISNVRLDTLRDALADNKYDIVHIIGLVGISDGSLIFSDTERIDAEGLLLLLQRAETKLVVLATCDSSVLGAKLMRHMNIISGIGNIKITDILKWENCFYGRLSKGETLANAYDLAQATTRAAMVLLMRNDAKFLPAIETTVKI